MAESPPLVSALQLLAPVHTQHMQSELQAPCVSVSRVHAKIPPPSLPGFGASDGGGEGEEEEGKKLTCGFSG